MKFCYVFGAGPISDYGHINIKKQKDDCVICADGGYLHANKLGLDIDVIIGDFDSKEKPEDYFVIEYPTKKDDTDMMLAVKHGLASGYRDFKIFGGLGGRFDHSIANVSLLLYLNTCGASGVLVDEKNYVYAVSDEDNITLNKLEGYKVSLLSLTDKVTGVTTTGLEYELDNAVLENTFPLGISNEFIENTAKISIKSGNLLVILSKD